AWRAGFLVVFVGAVVPLCFGLLFRLFVVQPIISLRGATHVVFLLQDWALGTLYTKILYTFVLAGPDTELRRTVSEARRQLRNGGLQALRVRPLAFRVIFPVVFASYAFLSAAFGPIHSAVLVADFENLSAGKAATLAAFRNAVPLMLLGFVLFEAAKAARRAIRGWMERVRDEHFLVGRRLHNVNEMPRAGEADVAAGAQTTRRSEGGGRGGGDDTGGHDDAGDAGRQEEAANGGFGPVGSDSDDARGRVLRPSPPLVRPGWIEPFEDDNGGTADGAAGGSSSPLRRPLSKQGRRDSFNSQGSGPQLLPGEVDEALLVWSDLRSSRRGSEASSSAGAAHAVASSSSSSFAPPRPGAVDVARGLIIITESSLWGVCLHRPATSSGVDPAAVIDRRRNPNVDYVDTDDDVGDAPEEGSAMFAQRVGAFGRATFRRFASSSASSSTAEGGPFGKTSRDAALWFAKATVVSGVVGFTAANYVLTDERLSQFKFPFVDEAKALALIENGIHAHPLPWEHRGLFKTYDHAA
ncbi:hypothetical protein HK405_012499, partial [Cladochytrium tenue]